MKKYTFGVPEKLVPSAFCKNFSYETTDIAYPAEKIDFRLNKRGCTLTLPLSEDEQIYGLGLQLKAFNLRGRKLTLRPNADPVAPTGDSHAPVPFFVSTAGYGIYVDTARYAEFYFGSSSLLGTAAGKGHEVIGTSTDELYRTEKQGVSNISIQIPVAQGVDIYMIEGDTITDIVAQYNMMAGGGCSVPDWALSAIYRCFSKYDQDKIIWMADRLKQDGMQVGTIGLEPGWHSHSYSCTYSWNPELYPEPQRLVDGIVQRGYHLNLWEHSFVHPDSPIYKDILPYSGDYEVWGGCVPDLSIKEAREIFAEHHRKIVGMGVDGFKLDECDSSDYTGSWSFPNHASFPSGLDGEQYHSLFGTLYMQTMLEALGDKSTLSEVRNAGALCAPYPFVLYSDLYDHRDFVRGCASMGFSGILWTPEVRDARSGEEFVRRLQSNVFSVQCLINAWYYDGFPWEEHGCADEVKKLLELRERLVPMLRAAFEKYMRTGIPPVRALVSDYTTDKETYEIDDEYIFCDKLIVAPIIAGEAGRRVYLPEGRWRNYLTGEPAKAGWSEVVTDSIPVYEKID